MSKFLNALGVVVEDCNVTLCPPVNLKIKLKGNFHLSTLDTVGFFDIKKQINNLWS